jgi:hypothetical protein
MKKDMKLLADYMSDIIGVPLSKTGVIRVAVKRYLEWMEAEFMSQIKKNDEDELKAFLASQKRYAIEVNNINPELVPEKVQAQA